jgi:hypothetical protein
VTVAESRSSGATYSPSLAVDQTGNAVAVWSVSSDPGDAIQAAIRPAALGTWTRPIDLAEAPSGSLFAATPSVAIDASGKALAVWNPFQAYNVQASDLTPNGPYLRGVSIPATGAAHSPVHLRIEPLPWVSPLRGPPHWQFGDGTSATGAVVSHVYAKPGQYTVTVTQADATGTSTASGSISVVAPTLHSLSQPSIRGVPRVGRTLLCLTGIWTGTAPIRYAFTWLRNRAPIQGAHRRRYAIRQRDSGTAIACRVTAKNLAGTISKTSPSVSVKR